jgi:hypothetical protein
VFWQQLGSFVVALAGHESPRWVLSSGNGRQGCRT